MNYKCKVCQNFYDEEDCYAEGRNCNSDGDWLPEDGRCFWCFLATLHEIYGGIMEPAIFIADVAILEDGSKLHRDELRCRICGTTEDCSCEPPIEPPAASEEEISF